VVIVTLVHGLTQIQLTRGWHNFRPWLNFVTWGQGHYGWYWHPPSSICCNISCNSNQSRPRNKYIASLWYYKDIITFPFWVPFPLRVWDPANQKGRTQHFTHFVTASCLLHPPARCNLGSLGEAFSDIGHSWSEFQILERSINMRFSPGKRSTRQSR